MNTPKVSESSLGKPFTCFMYIYLFFSVVSCFIDGEWKLKCHRIAVKSFQVQATAENIADEIRLILNNHKFDEIIGATRDGAANVEKACKVLKLNR